MRRLEGQVEELRSTLALLADVNASEVEAMAKRQQSAKDMRKRSKQLGRPSSASRPQRTRRQAASKRPGRLEAGTSNFARRVAEAMEEEEAHDRVLQRLRDEAHELDERRAALEERKRKADGDEPASAAASGGGPVRAQGAADKAEGTESERHQQQEEQEQEQEEEEGKEEDNEEALEGWAAEDEAWVRRVRQQYLDRTRRAGRQAARAASKGRAGAKRKERGPRPQSAKPRYMKSAEEVEREAGKMSITRRRFEEERRRLEEEERSMRTHRFRAKPVPRSTREALYDRVVAQAATRRRLQHEARKEELRSSMQPFTRMEEGDRRRAEEAQRKAAARLTEEQRALRQAARFRAHPVPPTTRAPDTESRARQERDAMREERVQARARQLLTQAQLPPRMALYEEEEAARRREREEQKRRADREEKRRNAVRPTPLPDFERLHGQFERSLARARRGLGRTEVQPFSFDSEERRMEEEARREARRQEAEDRLRQTQRPTSTQRGWDEQHEGGQWQATDGSDGGFGANSTGCRQRQRRHSVGGTAPAFRVSMTRAAQLRIEQRQRQLRERQAREEEAALEEERRQQRQREVDARVAPVVQALERARRPEPLAWQLTEDTPEAVERRRRDAEAFRREQERLQKLVQEAEARRPMLFTRESIDRARADAERAALSRVAASLEGTDRAAAEQDGSADLEQHHHHDQDDDEMVFV